MTRSNMVEKGQESTVNAAKAVSENVLHHQLTEEQTAKMNYIISFDEFQAKLIRGPPPG